MGLWEDAEAEAEANERKRLDAQVSNARAAETRAREVELAKVQAGEIDEFVRAMSRLGVQPREFELWVYSHNSRDPDLSREVKIGSQAGWSIARYNGAPYPSYSSVPQVSAFDTIVTPNGDVLQTDQATLGKKPLFGNAPVILNPWTLPIYKVRTDSGAINFSDALRTTLIRAMEDHSK